MVKQREYEDEIILRYRQKCHEAKLKHMAVESEIFIGEDKVSLHRMELFNGCSMLLPDTLVDMKYVDCVARYWRQNRPQIIKEIPNQDTFLTFNIIAMDNMEKNGDISEQLVKIRNDMEKIKKQDIFYDTGKIVAEELEIGWMDFKTFCREGSLYCFLFLFQTGEQMIVGNFHCDFPKYDIWKPAILKLLTTVQA